MVSSTKKSFVSDAETKIEIMKFLENRSQEVDKELIKLLPKKLDKKSITYIFGKARYEYSPETSHLALSQPVWDLLDRGGKRWRPLLGMLLCEALGGNVQKYKTLLASLEVVHNGSLMVDDIEDDSVNRRNKPCTHKIFGVDVAINAGNFMYFLPTALLINNPHKLPEKTLLQIYHVYNQELINIHMGQGMDIIWHRGLTSPTEKEYLQMTAYKTGTLARLTAKVGAILANVPEKKVELVGEFAEAIGVAFQIQDDILELTDAAFQKGKGSLCGDIHEGKRTLIVIRTLEKATPEEKKRLIEILDSHPTEDPIIQEALDIIKKYDGIEYSAGVAKEIMEKTWKKLQKQLPENNAKKVLQNFAMFMVNRKI